MTEKEYNDKVMGAIQFSLSVSKIAVERAGNEAIKEFAGFELAETTVLTSVLKDLGTIIPSMDEENKLSFDQVDSPDPATGTDKLYMEAQLKNHRFLRDLTEEYLKEAPTGKLDKEEMEGKHLAKLSLLIFNEHIAISERIVNGLADNEKT